MSKSSHLGLGALEKWDIATTSKFLKLYRNHKCLWDHTDPNYKDKNQRNNSLEEIANSMSLPGFDTRYVVLKIRALRSTYIYERRKVRQRLKNGEKFQTHLGWYHLADSFLRNYVVEKSYTLSGNTEDPNKDLPPPRIITEDLCASTNNTIITTTTKNEIDSGNVTQLEFYTTTTETATTAETKSELEFTLEEEEEQDPIDDIDDDDDISQIDQNQKIPQIVQSFIPPTLKRRNSNNNNNNGKNMKKTMATMYDQQQQHQQYQQQQQLPNFTNTSDNKTQFLTIESSTSTANNNNYLHDDQNEDEFETFAKSVAVQLKKIPKEDAYGLQAQIQVLLSQAKLKAMGKSTSIILTDSQNFLSFKQN